MSVTVPVDGEMVLASWGSDVATQLNRMIPLIMTADVAKTGATFTDVTGLTFACVAGTSYNIQIVGRYSVGGVNTGIGLGYNHPGGTARIYSQIFSASTTSATAEWLTATDTATGTSTTDSTASHQFVWRGDYTCTVSGTFAVRYNRNGTSTTVTIIQGSGGMVIASV